MLLMRKSSTETKRRVKSPLLDLYPCCWWYGWHFRQSQSSAPVEKYLFINTTLECDIEEVAHSMLLFGH